MSNSLFAHPHFERWKQRLKKNGNIINKIDVLGIVSRDCDNFFGAFLDCQLVTPEGEEISRCVLIQDDSVVIVPVLYCQDDGEIYTMMVKQRRIVDGEFSFEFPAGGRGMTNDPRLAASQEIQEELHLNIPAEDLLPLATNSIKIIPSTFGSMADFCKLDLFTFCDFA